MHWNKDAYKRNTKQHLRGGKRELQHAYYLGEQDDSDATYHAGIAEDQALNVSRSPSFQVSYSVFLV